MSDRWKEIRPLHVDDDTGQQQTAAEYTQSNADSDHNQDSYNKHSHAHAHSIAISDA